MDKIHRAELFGEELDLFLHLVTIEIVQQKTKFITADPRHYVRCPGIAFQYFGQTDKQGISGGMAMLVIDRFEIVDVEKQYGTIVTISPTASHPVLQAFNKLAAI